MVVAVQAGMGVLLKAGIDSEFQAIPLYQAQHAGVIFTGQSETKLTVKSRDKSDAKK